MRSPLNDDAEHFSSPKNSPMPAASKLTHGGDGNRWGPRLWGATCGHLSPGLPQTGKGGAGTRPPPGTPHKAKFLQKAGREGPGQPSLPPRDSRRLSCEVPLLGMAAPGMWGHPGVPPSLAPPFPSVGAGSSPPSKSGAPSVIPPFHHPVPLTSPPGVATSTRVFVSGGRATRSPDSNSKTPQTGGEKVCPPRLSPDWGLSFPWRWLRPPVSCLPLRRHCACLETK